MFIRLLMLILLFSCPGVAFSEDLDAKKMIQKVQDLMRAHSSIAHYRMTIQTPDWQRSISLHSWDDRQSKRLFMRILEPRKERDTAWLKVEQNLWMYLPKLERDIRIPASMMLSSWMGSDFSNDDLVKMDAVVNDYTHRIIEENADTVRIESTAKADAAVVWGKIIHLVRRDGIPLSDDYYDEHGVHMRHLSFRDIKRMDGRLMPTLWVMQSLKHPDKKSILELQDIQFNVRIKASVFTRAHLRSGHGR